MVSLIFYDILKSDTDWYNTPHHKFDTIFSWKEGEKDKELSKKE